MLGRNQDMTRRVARAPGARLPALPQLLALLLLPAAIAGCGGNVRTGYPYFAPASPEFAPEVMAPPLMNKDRETMRPVGLRGYGDNLLVIDVLMVFPRPPYASEPTLLVEFSFNALEPFAAADGRGYILRTCDGVPIRQVPLDMSRPLSPEIKQRYSLRPQLDAPIATLRAPDREYTVALVPVVVACDRPIPVGSCLEVRLDPARLNNPITLREPLRAIVRPVQESNPSANP